LPDVINKSLKERLYAGHIKTVVKNAKSKCDPEVVFLLKEIKRNKGPYDIIK